jgi:hypothetical protein
MRKLIIAFILFSGFIFAQGPNSTGKIRYDKKAELIKQLHDEYANNNFELFETIFADDATVYLGSTQKYTKKQLIEGFKSHHVLYKNINWGWLNTETATYKSGDKWTMSWGLWKGEGNYTGTANEIPGHYAYKWEGDKIVTAMYFYDPTSLNAEVNAMTNSSIDYGYEAMYSSSWKMGNPANSKIVLDIQKAAETNNFDQALSLIHPDIVINNADGSTMAGIEVFKSAFEGYIKENKFKINPMAWMSVVNENGEEWVLLWTEETITASDGSISSYYAHEGFKIVDSKVIQVNQFQQPKLK